MSAVNGVRLCPEHVREPLEGLSSTISLDTLILSV